MQSKRNRAILHLNLTTHKRLGGLVRPLGICEVRIRHVDKLPRMVYNYRSPQIHILYCHNTQLDSPGGREMKASQCNI